MPVFRLLHRAPAFYSVRAQQIVVAELLISSDMQTMLTGQPEVDRFQARLVELEAKQADLKKTLQHLIALSKIRDEAWRALSYGPRS